GLPSSTRRAQGKTWPASAVAFTAEGLAAEDLSDEGNDLQRAWEGRVPDAVLRGNEAMQRGFLQALFTADATVEAERGARRAKIRLSSAPLSLLKDVQRLLLNFGIFSRIVPNYHTGTTLPQGLKETRDYPCQARHYLLISGDSLVRFQREIGFLCPQRQELLEQIGAHHAHELRPDSFLATVAGLEPDGVELVYDLTEPTTHSFIANGIVVHNCAEQFLPAWGVCNLGHLNLSRFVEDGKILWDDLRRAARLGVRFLDNVIDYTPYFFEENERVQKNERRTGMGTMGLGEMLIHLGVRYGSPEALEIID